MVQVVVEYQVLMEALAEEHILVIQQEQEQPIKVLLALSVQVDTQMAQAVAVLVLLEPLLIQLVQLRATVVQVFLRLYQVLLWHTQVAVVVVDTM